jgi:hypothetical protein
MTELGNKNNKDEETRKETKVWTKLWTETKKNVVDTNQKNKAKQKIVDVGHTQTVIYIKQDVDWHVFISHIKITISF